MWSFSQNILLSCIHPSSCDTVRWFRGSEVMRRREVGDRGTVTRRQTTTDRLATHEKEGHRDRTVPRLPPINSMLFASP